MLLDSRLKFYQCDNHAKANFLLRPYQVTKDNEQNTDKSSNTNTDELTDHGYHSSQR